MESEILAYLLKSHLESSATAQKQMDSIILGQAVSRKAMLRIQERALNQIKGLLEPLNQAEEGENHYNEYVSVYNQQIASLEKSIQENKSILGDSVDDNI